MTQDLARTVLEQQAEIARLTKQQDDQDAAWSERVAVLTQENARLTAENEIRWKMEQKWQDRAEKAEAALSETHRQQRDSDEKLRNQRHEINWLRHQQVELKAALSESQALLAMAPEVAARLCDETADEALEESGPESRMISVWFRGQAKAIRAKTPADAQAALDARINAAREEGLRLAAKICTRGDDRAAILAKLKEADHE